MTDRELRKIRCDHDTATDVQHVLYETAGAQIECNPIWLSSHQLINRMNTTIGMLLDEVDRLKSLQQSALN